jgi:hypothetical protein
LRLAQRVEGPAQGTELTIGQIFEMDTKREIHFGPDGLELSVLGFRLTRRLFPFKNAL